MTELICEIDNTFFFDKGVIRVLGTFDEPWFVAKDVCNVLELSNITNALLIISDKCKMMQVIKTSGGDQSMILINEFALYKLIMRSNKKVAQKFQEYVCEDVLPSLRKRGKYEMQKHYLEEIEKFKKINYDQQQELERLNRYIKRKDRHKYQSGNCIYILSHPAFIDDDEYKMGSSKNVNNRREDMETGVPDQFSIAYHRLIKDMKAVENILKTVFAKKIINRGKEWFKFENLEQTIKTIDNICDSIEAEYNNANEENKTDEEIIDGEDLNIDEITDEETEEMDEITNNSDSIIIIPPFAKKNLLLLPVKPCNVCKLSKRLEEFNLASDHRDGRENTCTDCRRKKVLDSVEEKRLLLTELPTEKVCNKCNISKPLDRFRKQNTTVDGCRPQCKDCDKVNYSEKVKQPKIEVTEKKCSTCEVVKKISEFNKNPARNDGHSCYCKTCTKEKTKKYNEANKDKINAKKREKRKKVV